MKYNTYLAIALIALATLCLSALLLYWLLGRLGDAEGSLFFGWTAMVSVFLTALTTAALSLSPRH